MDRLTFSSVETSQCCVDSSKSFRVQKENHFQLTDVQAEANLLYSLLLVFSLLVLCLNTKAHQPLLHKNIPQLQTDDRDLLSNQLDAKKIVNPLKKGKADLTEKHGMCIHHVRPAEEIMKLPSSCQVQESTLYPKFDREELNIGCHFQNSQKMQLKRKMHQKQSESKF